jgi:hypothetical protein
MAGWAEYLGFLLLGQIEVWCGPYLAITGPPPLCVLGPFSDHNDHCGTPLDNLGTLEYVFKAHGIKWHLLITLEAAMDDFSNIWIVCPIGYIIPYD